MVKVGVRSSYPRKTHEQRAPPSGLNAHQHTRTASDTGYSAIAFLPRTAVLSCLMTSANFSRRGNVLATFWNTNQYFSDNTNFPCAIEGSRAWSLHKNWVAGIWRKAFSARVVFWDFSPARNKLVRFGAGASYA